MKLIRLKHEMDDNYTIMSLNDAFIKAIAMSDSCSCEEEVFENKILEAINSFENKGDRDKFLSIIKDDFKKKVIEAYGYKMDEYVWLEEIVPVQASIEAYPLSVESNFLVKLTKELHTDDYDLYDGDLLERIWNHVNCKFVLCEVNITNIDYDSVYICDSMVSEYMDENIETMPPIILDQPVSSDGEILNKFPIIDGAHRCATLKELGIEKIQAYIPVPDLD